MHARDLYYQASNTKNSISLLFLSIFKLTFSKLLVHIVFTFYFDFLSQHSLFVIQLKLTKIEKDKINNYNEIHFVLPSAFSVVDIHIYTYSTINTNYN